MSRFLAILAAVTVVVLLGIGLAITLRGSTDDRFAQCRASQVAGGDLGGPFELLNDQGETVTDVDVITEPTLIYFGYTFCPDVCPLDTARNAVAIDILEEMGVSATPIFISIDPNRDTPEVVGQFAGNLHEKMIGLTGTPEQVRAASQTYKTFYSVAGDMDDPYYLVDHSTMTYLVLPEYGFVEFFRRDATPDDIANTVACYAGAT
ncbi:SCO family protein [Meridianimarinicoccus aquatilis]|uniref:SCO family protein n=1 Tax=Meridianimarinicoccus aquatilis TaxID=2552766 RepID=A0A4R6AZ88_9RHOB|nr:SCO family protein [Fluviibacterium aquatile]QIE40779.1 SCO family protein [Rhodobacteraceae bacterium SC52]TDL89094.1 SCO family protein [Fluviibacterium aquatile]